MREDFKRRFSFSFLIFFCFCFCFFSCLVSFPFSFSLSSSFSFSFSFRSPSFNSSNILSHHLLISHHPSSPFTSFTIPLTKALSTHSSLNCWGEEEGEEREEGKEMEERGVNGQLVEFSVCLERRGNINNNFEKCF